ncbi:autotransporter-associated beta strand repeat-containing protein [Rubritalea squalenifaciens DSM 18772]|uniref:Autotransporter-associated beta strand repeat-containing protein n=1 Tax=Rubritalea squalenifaciens DSM 18772 TaxID=1123071 RepID=A0A1M6GZ13_9BACT|nr:autotransporter-associated beta strand repeat-containing protein [Rubritalea squalenifaciens]SHJ15144.1 autotransporter-associated beta strand repeat-containing protein [Rubritalea squalenifaciens DSM 18772]
MELNSSNLKFSWIASRHLRLSPAALLITGLLTTSGWGQIISYRDGENRQAPVSTSNNALLNLPSGIATQSGIIYGGGSITKAGAGELILTANNTYQGATSISLGSLRIGNNSTSGSLGSGNVNNNGSLIFDRSNTITVGNLISGTGSLTQDGSGTLNLGGAHTYTGATIINSGNLRLYHTMALQNSTVAINTHNGLNLNNLSATLGGLSGNGNLSLGSSTLTVGNNNANTSYSGTLSGSGKLTKIGSGVFTLAGSNTYSGNTTVNAGTLRLAHASALQNADVSIGSAGTLDLNNFNTNLTSISGSGGLGLGSATLTIAAGNQNKSFAGVISGTGKVVKTGSGSLTFTGANSYTGSTSVQAGSLVIGQGNTNALQNSAVTMAAGATLRFDDNGDGSEYRLASLAGGGTVDIEGSRLELGFDNSSTTFAGAFIEDAAFSAGVIAKYGSGTFTLTGSGHSVDGLQLREGSLTLDGTAGDLGDIQNLAGNTQLTLRNVNALSAESLYNEGTLLVTGANMNLTTEGDFDNKNQFTLSNGALLTATGSFEQGASDSTTIDQASLTIARFGDAQGTIAISDPTGGTALSIGSSSGTSTFAGAIVDHTSSSGSVKKTGNSTVIFSGANTYSGATSIEAGSLTISQGNSNALLNSAVTVASGATLRFDDQGDGFVYSIGSLAGAGTVDINGGDLGIGWDNSSTTFAGALVDDPNFNGDGIKKFGSGTLTLTGSGHHVTVLQIRDGSLILDGAAGDFGEIQINSENHFTIQNGSTPSIASLYNVGTLLVTGSSTDFTIEGSLRNFNQFSMSNGASLTATDVFEQSDSDTTIIDQASLTLARFGNAQGTIAISDPAGGTALTIGTDSDTSTFAGTIVDHTSGSGSIIKTGNSTIILSAANTFSGTIRIEEGIVRLGHPLALQNAHVIVGANGILDINGFNPTFASLSGVGNLALGTSTLTLGNGDGDSTFAGIISGTGGLIKKGTGSLTLTGANTYSGPTKIEAGKIIISKGNTSALHHSAVTVAAGATLKFDDQGDGFDYNIGSLAGGGTVDFSGGELKLGFDNSSTTFAGALVDAPHLGGGVVKKFGSGTLTLTGSGHSISELQIKDGSLIIDGAAGYLGDIQNHPESSQLTLQNVSTLSIDSIYNASSLLVTGAGTDLTVQGNLRNFNQFTLSNGARLTATGVFEQNASDTTTIDRASLTLARYGNALGTIAISDPADGTALTIGTNSGTSTFSGVIVDHTSGPGSITKAGDSTVIFSGANTYSGTTTVSDGTLIISEGNTTALRNSAVTVASGATLLFDDDGVGSSYQIGSLAGGGTVDFRLGELDVGLNNTSTTFSGAFTYDTLNSPGEIEKRGGGTLTLNGSNHSIGELEVFEGGILIDGASGNFGALKIQSSNSTMTIQDVDETFQVNSLLNFGTLNIIGGGTEVISTGDFTNENQLTISSGSRVVTSGDFFQSTGDTLTVDRASFTFAKFDNTAGTIAISDPDPNAGSALTVGSSNGTSTFSGIIKDHTNGPGSVTKTGNSTVIFSGANTYSGATMISEGTLAISNGNVTTLANSAVTVASGAQLTFDDVDQWEYRIGSVAGAGVIDVGTGTLDIGRDNASTTFSGAFRLTETTTSGQVEKNGSGMLTLTGSGHDVGLLEVQSGSVTLDGAVGSFDRVDALASTTIRNTDNAFVVGQLRSFNTLTITGAGTLVETTGNVENFNTLLVEDGATVRPLNEFIHDSGATTTVDRASLVVPKFGFTNKGTIAISDPTNGTALTIGSNSGNSTFAGTIVDHTSGPGSVTKTGSNSITLSGANTYSGATTIEAGNLIISEGNTTALSKSSVIVASGATLTFDDDDFGAQYQMGSIAGGGTVNYRVGELQVGSDNSSTLFDGSFTHETLNGSGRMEKRGSGALTLTGSGHLVGGLESFGGEVIFDGTSGEFGSIRSVKGSITFRNVDSNLGISDISNFKTLTVTGSNTGLTIQGDLYNEDQVRISSGASITVTGGLFQRSGAAIIVDEASFTFANFSNGEGTIAITDPTDGTALTIGKNSGLSTFAGTIVDHTSGPGSVTKTGNSTVILAGNNSYTGTTIIEAGTLKTDNLSGSLTNTSGTFSPGNSPAHTTISGDYTQQAAGTLEIELAGPTQGSEYDFLDISGTANLAGNINVTFLGDYSPSGGESFTILSAGTLTNNGYTLNLPDLANSGLEWKVGTTATSLTLSVEFTDNIEGFRAQYGLNPDGSDDFLDWSNNGTKNILYHAFGLGDPNNASINRSRLPSGEQDGDSFAFTYLEPIATTTGISITPVISTNLTAWQTPPALGELPTSTITEDLGDGYQRHTLTFPIKTSPRFFTVEVTVGD